MIIKIVVKDCIVELILSGLLILLVLLKKKLWRYVLMILNARIPNIVGMPLVLIDKIRLKNVFQYIHRKKELSLVGILKIL